MRSPRTTWRGTNQVRLFREAKGKALSVGLLLLGIGFFSGCSVRSPASPGRETKAVPVTVALAIGTNVPVRLQAMGRVSAYATVAVRSQVDGMLQEVHFHDGDMLRPGELMFTIDSKPFQTSLNQAKGNLEKDLALEKNATAEQQQNAELLRSKIISQETYDESATAAESLRSALAADRAAVAAAELGLSYCSIRSPILGRAGLVQVSPGNVINGSEMVLVTINQTQPIYVDMALPERELPRVRNCMAAEQLKVEAYLPEHPQPAVVGELAALDNLVDANSGTILLRALFPNQDEVLWPGQMVQAAIPLNTSTSAVVVPAQAVHTEGQSQFVFVVNSELRLIARPVETGDRVGAGIVLLNGIAAEEQVVLYSPNRLSAGMLVQIRPIEKGADSDPLGSGKTSPDRVRRLKEH